MLATRPNQIEAPKRGVRASFAFEIAPLLARAFPLAVRAHGIERVREAVGHAVERGARHGIAQRNDLYDFAHLSLLFGAGFDAHPLVPWAAEVLGSERCASSKLPLLWHRAAMHVRLVEGADGIRVLRAMLRARRMPFESVLSVKDVGAFLLRLHPWRYAVMTPAGLREFLDRGHATAEHHRVLPALWLGLMLLLGSRFDADPLHEWAAEVLDRGAADVLTHSRRLHAAAMDMLRRMCEGA